MTAKTFRTQKTYLGATYFRHAGRETKPLLLGRTPYPALQVENLRANTSLSSPVSTANEGWRKTLCLW